jgi:hypothetical protein
MLLNRLFQENHKVLLEISNDVKESLKKSLYSYYASISEGDLDKLSSLMTQESYLSTLSTLGFKKAFRDESFKHLLEEIEHNAESLAEVEKLLSHELKNEARKNTLHVLSYESKGLDRITLHYTQELHLKKIYFSLEEGNWKIDLKAGRKKDI